MRLRKYILRFDFWMQMLIMFIITLLLVFITIFMLRITTRHGEKIKVPDMSGYTIEELAGQTSKFDFQYIVRDSVFKKNAKIGTVIAQSPEAGSFVKQGRKFYVTVAASTPPYVKMPNLKDLSLRQAKSLLETYNIKIGRVNTVPSIGKAVVEQYYKGVKIAPGEKLPHGSVITLDVGSGIGSNSESENEMPLDLL
ncbi:MAG: PASTA domain-containing protein [Bacteroidales bacterium]|jgi:beta-lactam-binding protein with PASTA domain|nr:PASTA domain-containing protein [Bacteroidales bacterium]